MSGLRSNSRLASSRAAAALGHFIIGLWPFHDIRQKLPSHSFEVRHDILGAISRVFLRINRATIPLENISSNPPFGAFMFSSWAFDLEMRLLVQDFLSFLIVWILAFSGKLSHIGSWRSQIHSEYREICSLVR
jgi:hypothetical protein